MVSELQFGLVKGEKRVCCHCSTSLSIYGHKHIGRQTQRSRDCVRQCNLWPLYASDMIIYVYIYVIIIVH